MTSWTEGEFNDFIDRLKEGYSLETLVATHIPKRSKTSLRIRSILAFNKICDGDIERTVELASSYTGIDEMKILMVLLQLRGNVLDKKAEQEELMNLQIIEKEMENLRNQIAELTKEKEIMKADALKTSEPYLNSLKKIDELSENLAKMKSENYALTAKNEALKNVLHSHDDMLFCLMANN